MFFFRLFSRSKCIFWPKIVVSSTRFGGVKKRLSYYRGFLTFLRPRSQNRRENTMFSAAFFSSNFGIFSGNLEMLEIFRPLGGQKSAQKHVFLRYEQIARCVLYCVLQCFVRFKTKKTHESV